MKKVQNNLMFNKIKSFFSSVKEGLSKSSDSIKSNIAKKGSDRSRKLR